MTSKYRRIVLKLSGEALAGSQGHGIDFDTVMDICRPVKTLRDMGCEVAIVVGGGLSLAASGNPDGLEWSLFGNAEAGYSGNMGLDEDNFGVSSAAADTAASIQEKTALLPDYAFKQSDSPVGTSVSGVVGSALVAAFAALICLAGGFFRRKPRTRAEQ